MLIKSVYLSHCFISYIFHRSRENYVGRNKMFGFIAFLEYDCAHFNTKLQLNCFFPDMTDFVSS